VSAAPVGACGAGRTLRLVVISHDDRYYHLGNRVVKFDYGKFVREQG